MNVRVMTTNELLNQWMIKNTPREAADLIWDELYRRCEGVPISFSRYGQYRLYLLDGKKSLEFTIAVTAEFLDAKFLETSPQLTDGLAFEPSDELDAANCIELTGLKNPSVPASRRSGWILNTER